MIARVARFGLVVALVAAGGAGGGGGEETVADGNGPDPQEPQ